MSRPPVVSSIADQESVPGPDGLRWVPLRRRLGVGAFGINAYLADAGGEVVEEHAEDGGGGAGGHEELYLLLAGRASFTVDGDPVEVPAGSLVFCPDTATRRGAVAVEDGTVVLALGGRAGEAYRPGAWEWSFSASPLAAAGDYDGASAVLEEGLAEHPGDASLTYNLACYRSLAGRLDEAVELLASITSDPHVAGWAAQDSDLDPIRDRPDYPL